MIFRFLVYSNLFVSLCVAFLTWGTGAIFHVDFSHNHVFIAGLGTFVMYNAHRFVGQVLPTADKSRKKDLGQSDKLMGSLTVVALLVIAWRSLFLKAIDYWILAPAILMSVFYVSDLFFKKSNTGLRAIPLLKVFVIACTWSIITVLFPLSQAVYHWNTGHGMMWMERFFFILAITIPFDIRDMDLDKKSITTLPHILGVSRSIALSILFLFIALLGTIYLYLHGIYPMGSVVWAVAFYLLVVGLLIKVTPDRPDYFFSFWIEGTMLVWGLLLLYFSFY